MILYVQILSDSYNVLWLLLVFFRFEVNLNLSWAKVTTNIITSHKRSLEQGNVFTCVCHSVHRWGEEVTLLCRFLSGCVIPCSSSGCLYLWSHFPSGRDLLDRDPTSQTETPWTETPFGQRHPWTENPPPRTEIPPCMVGSTHATGMNSYFTLLLVVRGHR